MTTTITGLFIAVFISFLLYSPQVEKQRVLTIQKPLVITQQKKSPAFYLFQKVHNESKSNDELEIKSVAQYLSTETIESKPLAVQAAKMELSRREIASDSDAGFRASVFTKAETTSEEPQESVVVPTAEILESATRVAENQTEQPISQANKWATIKGKFELRGVGIVADHKIELKRIEEGQTKEVGAIDLKAGLYSIDISSPSGVLVAQIRDKNGIIIGQDRQKIINLQRRGIYFEGPFIQVKNTETVAIAPDLPTDRKGYQRAHVRSHQKSKDGLVASLFSGQSQLENVDEEMSNVGRHTSTIGYLHDVDLKYRSLLTIRSPGEINKTPMFSEKWSDAIVEYVSDMQKIQFGSKNPSIVIGQVLIDGKPASGINVQIENKPGLEAIYLDPFLIPSRVLNETSENGYFMFIGLDDGAYTLAALKQSLIVSSQVFVAQEGAVSFQAMSGNSKPTSMVARSFHAFTSEPVEAEIYTPDAIDPVRLMNGVGSYRKHANQGISHYNVRPNGDQFTPFHYFQDSRKDYAHFPLIEEAWLTNIQNEKQINDQAKTGTVIGFVPEFDYDVYVINESFDRNNVVYFDQNGQMALGPVKGGGFILFGVPVGGAEVIVQNKSNDTIYSQVFAIHDGQVHVSHFKEE